ncbi:MAG: gliding motility lipoprotein GldJ [Flavobacteriales bacterium]|nr:gliding motility lipoprotein GldJ [Flavobacteriales bacterium]|tara:strand:+ start:31638 stop:33116 length:1479 start_codon:yes stop_codon:yes gene_type:complete
MKNKLNIYGSLLLGAVLVLSSCSKERSSTTGWAYNDPDNGGFEKVPYIEQETGPGLVLIEGGRFTMGRTEQDIFYEWDNVQRTVTVSSFYMDETEVKNIDYREYLYWTKRVFGLDYPEVYRKALPDTLGWRSRMAFNEPYVEYYLRHPAYNDYPVVNVSWLQATDYAAWRTDRVNEIILIREGLFEHNPNQYAEDNFNTKAYLLGQYNSGKRIDGIPDLDPNKDVRNVRVEDGILLPEYRLPTEAEWEYAALGLIGNSYGELIVERKFYPWNGHGVRNADDKYLGQMLANFRRGRGDMMGVAGQLNDNAEITAPVYSYWPNDYGLYNMAGNVSEWVMDVYRPMTPQDADDFRPFRGNVFKTLVKDEEGYYAEKDSLGRMKYREVNAEDDNLAERRNYKKADVINYEDGDLRSSLQYDNEPEYQEKGGTNAMYDFASSTLISDRARVYKGGSWNDRAYWMTPGTRRFLQEDKSSSEIGFRCAMIRVGSPTGLY